MRVEFNHGVPIECIDWLWANVGPGNVVPSDSKGIDFRAERAWFYERTLGPDWGLTKSGAITVKDEKLGTLFALRWL